MQLIQIQCRECSFIFCICRSCWRGQAYCSKGCRESGRRGAHREAQRRYRKTEEGRRKHREAERQRRIRKLNKTSVADGGSTPYRQGYTIEITGYKSPVRVQNWNKKIQKGHGECHFCGVCGDIVEKFPRRGYG